MEINTFIMFKSFVNGIRQFDDKTIAEAFLAYADYALEGKQPETDNPVVKLALESVIPNIDASKLRYKNCVKNGMKGKEYGKLGKEYGKLGGRPRKGESKEEYWDRKRKEQETGEKEPYTPPVDEKRERAHNLARNYKKNDKKYGRGVSTLTTGWIYDNILSGQKCIYCGESDWHLLGCDRIDNSKPHTPYNVVCSCSKCNIERGSMTFEEFKEKKGITKFSPLKTPLYIDKDIDNDKDTILSGTSNKYNLNNNLEKNNINNNLEIKIKNIIKEKEINKEKENLININKEVISSTSTSKDNNDDINELQKQIVKNCKRLLNCKIEKRKMNIDEQDVYDDTIKLFEQMYNVDEISSKEKIKSYINFLYNKNLNLNN